MIERATRTLLSGVPLRIYCAIRSAARPVTHLEIAREIHANPSYVSTMLARLESQQCVSRSSVIKGTWVVTSANVQYVKQLQAQLTKARKPPFAKLPPIDDLLAWSWRVYEKRKGAAC